MIKSEMEPDDKSQSLENSPSFVIIQKMTADNQKQIELNDSLLKNSSFTALMEKFNADSITKNQPLAEDIENTVQELLKENSKLKETLLQNNVAMKEQFSTLEKWHNEVFDLQRTHKKKFEETKELVYNLRAENKELKKPVQEYLRNHENKELVELRMEKENLQQQLQESEQHCISLKNQLTNVARLPAENQILKEKLQLTQQKLLKLEQHYSMNARSEKEQELIQVIGDLTRQLENSERSRRKLVSDLDRLSAQEQKLQRILPSGESKNITDYCYWNAIFPTAVISAPFEAQLVENMKRYEELLNKYENLSLEVTDNSKETSSSWVNLNKNEQESSIDSLKLEVAELRKLLMQEQRLNISRKEILENAQLKFKELYKQCMAILKEHDTKMKAMEIEIVKSKEKFKDFEVLKYAVNDKDNKITQLENECAFLKKKIEEAERKNEDLYILQSQMKVYEEDFLTEREAREALANEKDLLQHSISRLQQKNKELLRELKMSQDGKGHKSRNNKDICEETVSIPEHPIKKKFACFNETCSESFLSEEELQEHVYSCLNLKD